jgi:hypothetical protein
MRMHAASIAPMLRPLLGRARCKSVSSREKGGVDHSLGDLPAASGHQLAATATATLFEYYACVAEKQYPAAHTGLLQTGALCPGPAQQRNYFLQFNQALCALREYCTIYARS